MKIYLSICVIFLSSCGGASAPSHPASGGGTTYAITPTADANGTISPSGVTQVASGGTQAFTMACNSGYTLDGITVDGSAVSVSSPYTFTNVVTTHTITFHCALIHVPSSIAVQQEIWTNMAVRGTPYYYCDCQAGAAGNCEAGSDTNAGTSALAPRQTLINATHLIDGWTDNTQHTVALCKGGAFSDLGDYGGGLSINRNGCTAGTDCDDIREYASPVFTSSAAPLIVNSTTGIAVFQLIGNYGGLRIFNLHLTDTSQVAGTNVNTDGIALGYDEHDITFANNTVDHFTIGVQLIGDENANPSIRSKVLANTFNDIADIGILGGSNAVQINYNTILNSGTRSPGAQVQTHSIYMSGHILYSNVQVVGNYISNTISCAGVEIVGHGQFDYLTVSDNVIYNDPSIISNTCFGIGFGSAPAYPEANFFSHALFARNTIINAGALSMSVGNAPGAIIEDNLIATNYSYGSGQWPIAGFGLNDSPSRTTPYVDGVNTAMTIRNNTVWFGPAVTGGAVGIDLGVEGTGHIVANNSVVYSASTIPGNRNVGCYAYELANTAFAFINNNHCYSGASGAYFRVTVDSSQQIIADSTRLSLSAWQAYAATQGWDTASIQGAPNFVNPSTTYGSYNFKPNTGSPLIGAGSHANAPTYDLTGVSTFGNPPDIGAYTH